MVTCAAGSAAGQSTISIGDSVTRSIAAQSAESLFVVVRDGDYVKLAITHPTGMTINVMKPGGSVLRQFITPDEQGLQSIAFVAEGAGRYAIAVINAGTARAQYGIVFRERVSLDERTRVVPTPDAAVSPRMEAIRRQLDSGKTGTSDFWEAVKKEGTPFVEPLDSGYDLVTFLWRQEGETKNVTLLRRSTCPRRIHITFIASAAPTSGI